MVKTELHFFGFSLQIKITKIFAIKFFRVFYSDTEIDQILTVYKNQPVEYESVESFDLPPTVLS
jgi:hypothetical protein